MVEHGSSILGVRVDFVRTMTVLEQILAWRQFKRSEMITLTNAHSVLLCHRDERMAEANRKAKLTLPDGIGITLAACLLKHSRSKRVTGPQLMLDLCDMGRRYKLRHYFYGGERDVVDRLSEKLCGKFPGLQLAGKYHPPLNPIGAIEDDQVIETINATKPDILWVGLGAPKQEIWMLNHRDRLNATALVGVGAAFDFHSGRVKWAPALVRKCGLEWAWRLALNPRQMWRRNWDSPKFLAKVIAERRRAAFAPTPSLADLANHRHVPALIQDYIEFDGRQKKAGIPIESATSAQHAGEKAFLELGREKNRRNHA